MNHPIAKRRKRSVLPPTTDESLLRLEALIAGLQGEVDALNDRVDKLAIKRNSST